MSDRPGSTPSWLLPGSVRRFRDHLRELRRVVGENQQHLREIAAAVTRLETRLGQLADTEHGRAIEHAHVLEALHFILSRGDERRERLRALRSSPAYERPYTEPDPLVSVVIATYDNYPMLRERAIPSVLAQTYQSFEIVVVGDAAPEEAREVVESFGDPRVRFSNLPYRGPYPDEPEVRWRVAGGPPFNEGARLARGLWIAPLADDDAFRPHHLERRLDHARSERLELAYARLCMHSAEGETTTIGDFPPRVGQFGMQMGIYHHGLARIFELELADAALGLPQDWGLCRRMMEAGVRMGMMDDDTCDYYPSRSWTPRWEE